MERLKKEGRGNRKEVFRPSLKKQGRPTVPRRKGGEDIQELALNGKTPHLMVATPCFDGHITGIYSNSLLKLQQACAQRQMPVTVRNILGDALITRARQNLLAYFMENKDATHLLFIDADIGFEPAQVFRLLDYGADFTAAAYPVKSINWDKLAELAKADKPDLAAASLDYVVEFHDPGRIDIRRGFARVSAAGTGFLMVRRQAVQKMMEGNPDLRYTRDLLVHDDLTGSPWRYALFNCMIDRKTGAYLSEDYSFCRRWTELGGEIWLDMKSSLIHAGTTYYRGDMATQIELTEEQSH
jgi:hypothetical protein